MVWLHEGTPWCVRPALAAVATQLATLPGLRAAGAAARIASAVTAPPTMMRSRMPGLARPVRSVLSPSASTCTPFFMRTSCAALRQDSAVEDAPPFARPACPVARPPSGPILPSHPPSPRPPWPPSQWHRRPPPLRPCCRLPSPCSWPGHRHRPRPRHRPSRPSWRPCTRPGGAAAAAACGAMGGCMWVGVRVVPFAACCTHTRTSSLPVAPLLLSRSTCWCCSRWPGRGGALQRGAQLPGGLTQPPQGPGPGAAW